MMMDPDIKFGKKRPPKLKNTDRTISITIDNYKPPAPIIIDGTEMILEEGGSNRRLLPQQHPGSAPLNYEYTVIGEASGGALSAPNSKANIFYLDPLGTSSSGHSPMMDYDDDNNQLLLPQQYSSSSRRNSFRRSDTLDVCGPALMQLRKTRSFHSNEPLLMPPTDDLLLVRRTSNTSNRSSQLLVPVQQAAPLATPERSPMSDRRNCATHRSFNDIVKQRLVARKFAAKCHSFSESVYQQQQQAQHQQMGVSQDSEPDDSQMETDSEMFAGEVVIERDRSLDRDSGGGGEVIIRSRSNSRNRLQLPLSSLDDEIIIDYSPRPQMRSASVKKSHNSLQEQQQQQSTPHQHFKRGVRQAQSFYLSPHSYDELRVSRSSPRSSQNADNRKVYSSSVKYKEEKKPQQQQLSHGRSFIADMLPVPKMGDFEGAGGGSGRVSPYSWDKGNRCYTDDQLGVATQIAMQRSPRLSQSIKLNSGGGNGSNQGRGFERRTSSLGYDISPGANSNSNISLIHSANNSTSQMDMESYDAVIRAFQRKSPRKGSLGSSGRAGSGISRSMSVRKKASDVDILGGMEIGAGVGAAIVGGGSGGGGKQKPPVEDEETLRKRRRIICIITTVFFTLVLASVCVVAVMLAHTSGYSQGGNQSKKYVARGSPIHHTPNSSK